MKNKILQLVGEAVHITVLCSFRCVFRSLVFSLTRAFLQFLKHAFFRHHGTFAHTSSFLEKVYFSTSTRLITSVFCFRWQPNSDLFQMLSLILPTRFFFLVTLSSRIMLLAHFCHNFCKK